MARILCPFCLKPHDFNASRLCSDYQNLEIPQTYIHEYREVPPLWLATVGFPEHGKTTYLAALSLMLQNLTRVFPSLYFRELDNYTIDELRNIRKEAEKGKNPDATPKTMSRPMLLSVYNLPKTGSRCLVMYDVAGEVYRNLGEMETHVPSLKEVTTTWFLVSLDDLESKSDKMTITELFNIYLTGMQSMRINLRGRNLIVVYTKADKLKHKEIRSYLQSDPLQSLTLPHVDHTIISKFNYDQYINSMEKMSIELEEFTRQRVPLGASFINMVRAQGMNLVFCVASALGDSPDTETRRLRVDATRYRVLDPLFWAIKLEQPRMTTPLALLLDGSRQSQRIYEGNTIPYVWNQLAGQGELNTYFLGQRQIASLPDQSAPTGPPGQGRLRLLGPILDKLDPGTRLMVITTGRILDLPDFRDTEWREQLLLVTFGDETDNDWPHMINFRNSDAPSLLVDAFFRLPTR